MKNLPIVPKFLAIQILFAFFTLAVALFAGGRIMRVDDGHTVLISKQVAATVAMARTNRNLSQVRAPTVEIEIAYTDATNRYSFKLYEDTISRLNARFDEAIGAYRTEAGRKLRDLTFSAIYKCDHAVGVAKALDDPQDIFREECHPEIGRASEALKAAFEPMKIGMEATDNPSA